MPTLLCVTAVLHYCGRPLTSAVWQAAVVCQLACGVSIAAFPLLPQSQKGLPLVTRKDGGEEQETKRIHVYGPTWALQPGETAG